MVWFSQKDCALADFKDSIEAGRAGDTTPKLADDFAGSFPVYEGTHLPAVLDSDQRRDVLSEMHTVLATGAGAVLIRNAYSDHGIIDDATAVFNQIMEEQRAAGGVKADHFGENDRIWNAVEKLCLRAPQVFARYFGNPSIAAVCEAWLGPNYQMTAQTNLVRPGGKAQTAHRDYHLGFQTADAASTYPASVHRFSQFLTLQGGIAHVDMPVASGPTKLLPYSQVYEHGYLGYELPEFSAYFEENFEQHALNKGDVIFFNPALFHGAGTNQTKDIERLVNLIQVSSAFGRAMETVDRDAMCRALYPALQEASLPTPEQQAAIAACAEGYSFPTNLDTDPPVGGLAPKTQAELMTEALDKGSELSEFEADLSALAARRLS